MRTFSRVIVFLNHKLSGTRFLSVESEFPNNLKLRILGNENISTKLQKRLEINAWSTELKVFTVALENCEKSLLEHFTKKPILLDFKNLSISTFCPRFKNFYSNNIWFKFLNFCPKIFLLRGAEIAHSNFF